MGLPSARRKDHQIDEAALVAALHAAGAHRRPVTVKTIERHLGPAATLSAIQTVAAANSSLVTDNGDGTFTLTDAGLVLAREHPSDRSYSTT